MKPFVIAASWVFAAGIGLAILVHLLQAVVTVARWVCGR